MDKSKCQVLPTSYLQDHIAEKKNLIGDDKSFYINTILGNNFNVLVLYFSISTWGYGIGTP